MTAQELMSLAERCEAATGAEYVLDCAIWDAIYPGERAERFRRISEEGPMRGRLGPADMDGYAQPLRSFTASLDGALTLVPEGYLVAQIEEDWREPQWRVRLLKRPTERQWQQYREGTVIGLSDALGDASTAALALCAAALRARASSDAGGRG